ncbi:hypothetical protein INR49_027034, partial [Caranx melampygus]
MVNRRGPAPVTRTALSDWVRGSGHGEDSGSGVEVWNEERRGLGKEGKDVGSDGRIWVQMSEGDQL